MLGTTTKDKRREKNYQVFLPKKGEAEEKRRKIKYHGNLLILQKIVKKKLKQEKRVNPQRLIC